MNATNLTRTHWSWGLAALALILALAVMGVWAHQSATPAEASGETVLVQDVNRDGKVGFAEFMAVLRCYGRDWSEATGQASQQYVGSGDTLADCSLSDSWPETPDAKINLSDFLMVLKFYGQDAAPPPSESPPES